MHDLFDEIFSKDKIQNKSLKSGTEKNIRIHLMLSQWKYRY